MLLRVRKAPPFLFEAQLSAETPFMPATKNIPLFFAGNPDGIVRPFVPTTKNATCFTTIWITPEQKAPLMLTTKSVADKITPITPNGYAL